MTRPRFYFHLLIFITCLGFGYQAGVRLLPERLPLPRPVAKTQPTAVPALPNGQRSLLIIIASELEEAEPQLEGIWLALYVPNDARVSLLPIYPVVKSQDAHLANTLQKSFQIREQDGKRIPGDEFLNALQKQDLWWSGYILVDRQALVEIAALLNDQKLDTQESSPLLQVSINDAQDSWEALFNQAQRFQDICFAADHLEDLKGKNGERLSGRVFSDLDPKQMWAELNLLQTYGGNLLCEFPTLSIQTISFR